MFLLNNTSLINSFHIKCEEFPESTSLQDDKDQRFVLFRVAYFCYDNRDAMKERLAPAPGTYARDTLHVSECFLTHLLP